MNWLGLLAALIVALLLQTTVARMGDLPLIDLDLLLVLTLIYGLLAPLHEARLSAWIIGFAADLMTEGPIGVHAFAFGLVGLLLTQMREVINKRLWWGRLLICFLAALSGELLIVFHLRLIQGGQLGTWWHMLASAFSVAMTAALAAALLTLIPSLAPRRYVSQRVPWARK